jgi:hypothetical protein
MKRHEFLNLETSLAPEAQAIDLGDLVYPFLAVCGITTPFSYYFESNYNY